jgi:DnaJ-class molecular chaperone
MRKIQNAQENDIKKAYRKMAVKHHPDKGGDEETFKKISRAYEVLADKEQRHIYDNYGEEGLEQGYMPAFTPALPIPVSASCKLQGSFGERPVPHH